MGDNLAVAAENPDDLDTVLLKFDTHYGHKKYRSIKRQAFFDRKQKENEPIMSFVADIKMKARECNPCMQIIGINSRTCRTVGKRTDSYSEFCAAW